jgi:hypothetical protein
MLPKFIKVFPHEYKRVLGLPQQARAAVIPASAGSERRVSVLGD